MGKKYYTVQEFAKLMGVTERTVYNWIKSKEVDSIKIGRCVRIVYKEEK